VWVEGLCGLLSFGMEVVCRNVKKTRNPEISEVFDGVPSVLLFSWV